MSLFVTMDTASLRSGVSVLVVVVDAKHIRHARYMLSGLRSPACAWVLNACLLSLPQDSKQRLKAMQKCSQPITAGAYNHDGSIYAHSVSYDWSRGHAEHNPATAKNYILLHSPNENEVKARQRVSRR